MIRVLIVASTLTVRAGLRALLAPSDFAVVHNATTFHDPSVDLSRVDVILVAEETLLGAAERVLPIDGTCAIALMSDNLRAVAMLRALPLRGWGIIESDTTAAELDAVVRAVANGLVVLPPQMARQLLGQRTELEEQPEPLTPRERGVLDLLSQGLPNKLIAQRLQISEHTVKFHISSIYTKLGVSNRTEAISRGARRGLITL
jgi:DNA-binding NarL/FixJ family response regulator